MNLLAKLERFESGFTCAPFLVPTGKLGIDVYRGILARDPAAPLPHVITIEGIDLRGFVV